ncbi:MAG TPA: FAD-dependent oxidoreductase [Candidatus Nitrosotalea sp.]|nr:FAD-dependent oxidoreductase [Candidatus Nitrosotalea sp.]
MTGGTRVVTCCVVGGGPAGMMLGLLLARAGVSVLVMEKHADFLRDFRGDTIHPSTLELMRELGLLEEFLKLPHQEVPRLIAQFGNLTVPIADFTHLPTHCKFIALMPQWDFLDFLARQAACYPTFQLLMQTEATGLVEDAGRVTGVRATAAAGPLDVRADLVVAADGRSSVLRERAGLPVEELGAPMDVFWFRLSRRPTDPAATMGRFDVGRIFVLINRGEHWQCGYVIAKDSADEVRRRGLDAFRAAVAGLVPFASDRVGQIRDWTDVKLLTVKVDRLRRWHRPGLLCIGDAAHAMSPVGGVGINLAIQDAVAAANRLWRPLRDRGLTTEHLADVQRRREWPTRVTQALQVAVQRRLVTRALGGGPLTPPLFVRLLVRFPFLRRLPARAVGVGIRAEHVQTPAVARTASA